MIFQLEISSKSDIKAENISSLCKNRKGERAFRRMLTSADVSLSPFHRAPRAFFFSPTSLRHKEARSEEERVGGQELVWRGR